MIDATPNAKELWAGIAGHFDSITQVICEFIDNSVSNLEAIKAATKSIRVNVEPLNENTIRIQIEDTGSGIVDLAPVMRLGDQTIKQTPLNEHGFGLKHALASADPSNTTWAVFTRTKEDFKAGTYRELRAPYSFQMNPLIRKVAESPWPGVFNGSGTLVQFECSVTLFNTIQRGIKGVAKLPRCLDYLTEELGYIYSGVIEKGQATITVFSESLGINKNVESVKPAWVDFYPPGSGTTKVDLGGGSLQIEYEFGEMRESNYVKHYKRNQSTSGVEIRINGRLIMSNLFKDIWQLEHHPSYNHFLARINLVAKEATVLPKTRTSKNGIRSGDPKLEKLFEWIRSTHPTPHKDLAGAQSERELVAELLKLKNTHIRAATKHIEQEFKVFTSLNSPVSVDLYVFDGTDIVMYEAKKDTADIQDIYQLLMYWDGAVEDGKHPSEGILIASQFSPGVDPILAWLNEKTDRSGNRYKFSKKTWADEGIKYPR
jgi:hypothetical protein